MSIPEYGDYIIFIDESGDHGLQFIDQEYPIFALVLVVIKKSDYYEKIVPDFLQLKFKYWGHDQVILHEHDIRKEKGLFGLLRTNPQLRSQFLDDLSLLIQQSPFEFIGAVIRKEQLLKKYSTPYNPYEIALKFCLEDTISLLKRKGQLGKKTTLIVEGRGPKENKDLELEFRRICDNQRSWGYKTIDYTQIPFDLICVDKKCNSTGLQLADLIARPIGLRMLRPEQDNRAMDAIKEKWRSVKCFP